MRNDTSIDTLTDTSRMDHPQIALYLCNWCAVAAADLAGVTKSSYPAKISFISVPCTGTLNPALLVKTLQKGADGILVVGCSPGDCHHVTGNLYARRKFSLLKSYLGYIGVDPERLQFAWVSGADGRKLSAILKKVIDDVKEVIAKQLTHRTGFPAKTGKEGFIDQT